MQKVDCELDESSRFSFLMKSHSCVSGKFAATEILSNVLIMMFDDFRHMKSGRTQAAVARKENTDARGIVWIQKVQNLQKVIAISPSGRPDLKQAVDLFTHLFFPHKTITEQLVKVKLEGR